MRYHSLTSSTHDDDQQPLPPASVAQAETRHSTENRSVARAFCVGPNWSDAGVQVSRVRQTVLFRSSDSNLPAGCSHCAHDLSPRVVRTQISEMMDAFYTGLSRHALLSSVADENMNPAVTSFCCCCDVMLTKHTYSQSALITSRRQQSSIDPSIFCREFVERQTTNAFSRANMKPLMKGYPYSSQIQQAMAIRTIVVLCWCVVLSCCHLSVVVYLRGKMIVYRSYTTARQ